MVYVVWTPESDTCVEGWATPYTGGTIDEGVGNGCMIDNSAVLESHGTHTRLYLQKKPALIIQVNLSITFIDNSSELLII
jgi:hypothetical protein